MKRYALKLVKNNERQTDEVLVADGSVNFPLSLNDSWHVECKQWPDYFRSFHIYVHCDLNWTHGHHKNCKSVLVCGADWFWLKIDRLNNGVSTCWQMFTFQCDSYSTHGINATSFSSSIKLTINCMSSASGTLMSLSCVMITQAPNMNAPSAPDNDMRRCWVRPCCQHPDLSSAYASRKHLGWQHVVEETQDWGTDVSSGR